MSKNKGFTLIEITVVVVIITFLATIFIVSYREGEKQFALKRSAHQVAQAIRKAQELALSSQEYMGAFQGGYGICFDKTLEGETGSYSLFVDCEGDYQMDSVNNVCDNCLGEDCYPFYTEKLEEVFLEKRIKISNLSTTENTLCITFTPPDPAVNIFPEADSASITLNFDGGPEKIITVNKVGLIEIK